MRGKQVNKPYTAHLDTFALDNLPPRELWPELIFETPALQYPERLNCVVELLDKMVAAGHGERVAIRAPRRVLTYGALLELVNRIARVLTEDLALVPGNRVLLRAPNNPMMAASSESSGTRSPEPRRAAMRLRKKSTTTDRMARPA